MVPSRVMILPRFLATTGTLGSYGHRDPFSFAVFGTKHCSNCPQQYLTKSQVLQILFAGDLRPTQMERLNLDNGEKIASVLSDDGCPKVVRPKGSPSARGVAAAVAPPF